VASPSWFLTGLYLTLFNCTYLHAEASLNGPIFMLLASPLTMQWFSASRYHFQQCPWDLEVTFCMWGGWVYPNSMAMSWGLL